MIKLIAGLGNPGAKYENTRHNVGFKAIDRLLEISKPISERLIRNSLLFETENFGLLCKPLTYMNHSGAALSGLAHDYELQPGEILVLYDDFALELGLLRVRQRGSSGGHNGLESIIEHFGTTEIPRVRMGIKTDEMDNWVDFVLGTFRKAEKPVVAEMIDLCCDSVAVILKEGITTAMNRFNKKNPSTTD
ncbi:MAG: aminoacyl-tRNA hydrolase [Acidobacteria bacterium]|nr:MAG: aminoacyl-tRNA hydrolase [Acidobacteriota bacterium]